MGIPVVSQLPIPVSTVNTYIYKYTHKTSDMGTHKSHTINNAESWEMGLELHGQLRKVTTISNIICILSTTEILNLTAGFTLKCVFSKGQFWHPQQNSPPMNTHYNKHSCTQSYTFPTQNFRFLCGLVKQSLGKGETIFLVKGNH